MRSLCNMFSPQTPGSLWPSLAAASSTSWWVRGPAWSAGSRAPASPVPPSPSTGRGATRSVESLLEYMYSVFVLYKI